MVRVANRISVKRIGVVLRVVKVIDLEYARDPADSDRGVAFTDAQNVRVAEIVNVGRDPATHVELPKIVGSLVVASDKENQARRHEFSSVVLVKLAQLKILRGTSHVIHIMEVSERLNVAAQDKKVEFEALLLLDGSHGTKHFLVISVEATFNGYVESIHLNLLHW